VLLAQSLKVQTRAPREIDRRGPAILVHADRGNERACNLGLIRADRIARSENKARNTEAPDQGPRSQPPRALEPLGPRTVSRASHNSQINGKCRRMPPLSVAGGVNWRRDGPADTGRTV
jgi:hypothetical protein